MAVISIIDARQLLKRGQTADDFFPSQTEVVTTTTINDTQLNLLTWEREVEIVNNFNSDYHIPADYSLYGDMNAEDRQEAVRKLVRGTEWVSSRINCESLPLLKGLRKTERQLTYQLVESVDAPCGVFYATQYFTGGGNRIIELETDIDRIATECDLDVLLLGLLSPNYLSRLSDVVVAGSGIAQWRERISPSKMDKTTMQYRWASLASQVADELTSSSA